MASLKVLDSYFLLIPNFQLQEVQVWETHALEAGVLGNSVSVGGGNQPPANNTSELRVWDYDLFWKRGFLIINRLLLLDDVCTPWAPIAFLINTKTSISLLQTDSEIGFAPAKWLILTGPPASETQTRFIFFRWWKILRDDTYSCPFFFQVKNRMGDEHWS